MRLKQIKIKKYMLIKKELEYQTYIIPHLEKKTKNLRIDGH